MKVANRLLLAYTSLTRKRKTIMAPSDADFDRLLTYAMRERSLADISRQIERVADDTELAWPYQQKLDVIRAINLADLFDRNPPAATRIREPYGESRLRANRPSRFHRRWTEVHWRRMLIDTSFDFRTDAYGKDPDAYSPTLRQYHKLLWSKALPSGRFFDLSDTVRGTYLHHRSEVGEFFLSSDSVIPTFAKWASLKRITELFTEEENEAFRAIGYTIGGMMVFPGNRIDGRNTMNGARGFNRKIADRFDLTLECIRRHYLGQHSPLGDTLIRYRDFFALFDDFRGYVEFFMLQDLVTTDGSAVKFFMPFDDFKTRSVPWDGDSYKEYRRLSIEFVEARNRRIGFRNNVSRSNETKLPLMLELHDNSSALNQTDS